MKLLLSLLLAFGWAGVATAAPYVIYSGTASGDTYSSAGATKESTIFYLLIDLADTSHFFVLTVDGNTRIQQAIYARPDPNLTEAEQEDEALNNFLGGTVFSNGKGGMAAFRFHNESMDGNQTDLSDIYTTGALAVSNFILVPAWTKPLVVQPKINGANYGSATTFSTLSGAIETGNTPFARTLTGFFFGNTVQSDASSSQLSELGNQESLTLTENPTATALVNIGGASTVGRDTYVVQPLVIGSGGLVNSASSWLLNFGLANEFPLPYGDGGGDGGGSITLNTGSSTGHR